MLRKTKTTKREATPIKNKKLKSLTLPASIADQLEQLAKKTGCKQADIAKIAISDILELNENELKEKLINYRII